GQVSPASDDRRVQPHSTIYSRPAAMEWPSLEESEPASGRNPDRSFVAAVTRIGRIADQPFTVFGKALRENGDSVLIFDDLDFSRDAAPSANTSLEGTIDALHDFCPN